jgi:hypothetical protein
MSTLTIQTASNAFGIDQVNHTANHVTDVELILGSSAAPNLFRGVCIFDFSALPAGALISAAVLEMYCQEQTGAKQNIGVSRCLRADLNLSQATWDNYKTGSAWTAEGCSNGISDYTTTNATSALTSDADAWWSCSIKDMVAYAQTNTSEILYLRLDSGEVAGAWSIFHSSYYSADTSLRPKLTITYTTGWATIAKYNGIATSGIGKINGVSVASIGKINGVAV